MQDSVVDPLQDVTALNIEQDVEEIKAPGKPHTKSFLATVFTPFSPESPHGPWAQWAHGMGQGPCPWPGLGPLSVAVEPAPKNDLL